MADFESLRVGDTAHVTKVITEAEIARFAELSGDANPLHLDAGFAARTGFRKPVAHGMLLASYVSGVVGMQLPGAGALWTRQEYRWAAPVFAGDEIRIELRATHKSEGSKSLTVALRAVNQNGVTVMEGEGMVTMVEPHEAVAARGLRGRVAFVTGASRGIGAAIARALGQAGTLVGVDYQSRAECAEQVCHSIEAIGGRAIALHADVRDQAAVEQAIAHLRSHYGAAVEVLVNNATGPPPIRPFLELQWQDFQELLDVQVRGAYHCCQAVLPGMVAAHTGRIVNIGSAVSKAAPPAQRTAFTVAKAALHALTRSLAVEYGPQGVQVNTVSPGTTETETLAGTTERLRKVQAMQTPLRRLATPADVAAAVVFLCSEGAEFISGADLPVCGGWSM